MLLTAGFSSGGAATSSDQTANNSTHNETLTYTYDNSWIYDFNMDNISNILVANNITDQQIQNFLQNISNTSDISRAIMNVTGLNWNQIQNVIDFLNINNDPNNITIDDWVETLENYQKNVDKNLAAMN